MPKFLTKKLALSVIFAVALLSLFTFSIGVVQNPGYLDKNPSIESSESISESELYSFEWVFILFLVFSGIGISNSLNVLIVKIRELILCDSGIFSISKILRIEKFNIPPPYHPFT
ncbi:hypothetical protein AB3N59_17885 [Leptospira sp. WS92.C1]